MEKLYCITSTDGETYFYIDILETGWIYDVFLILTYEVKTKFEDGEYFKVKANYSGKTVINDRTYSRFEAFYKFDKPADFMASYFIYTIKGETYVTDPICFAVRDNGC